MSKRAIYFMIGLVALAVIVSSFCLGAASDPFTGVWKLNLAKSKLPPPLPKSQTVRMEVKAGSILVREEIVPPQGQQVIMSVKAMFDGKDYPVNGSAFVDSVAYQRKNRHTIIGSAKKNGKVVVRETAVVSPDGKTLTGTYSGTDSTGKKVTGVAVFDKQ